MKRTIALLLSLLLVLSACGATQSGNISHFPGPDQTPPEPQNISLEEAYLQKAEEVLVTEDAVTFTDDSGREALTISKKPEKVAVLFGSLTCLWYEAGGEADIVIGGDNAVGLYKEQIGRDITADEGVMVAADAFLGTSWDIEAILAEKPDLIICTMGMKGYETIGGPAQAAGIPVIGINYDGVQDYLKWFKVFCHLSGHPELWESVADTTVRQVAAVVNAVPQDQEPLSVVILVTMGDKLKASTALSQPGTILRELEGVNLADPEGTASSANIDISLEDIYALDPDLILISDRSEPGLTQSQLDNIVGDSPVWASLRAVENDQVLFLEKGLFHNKANRRYGDAYRTLAEIIYPDGDFS